MGVTVTGQGEQRASRLNSLHLLAFLGLHVGGNKELDKEDKEGENVSHVNGRHTGVAAVLRDRNVGSLRHHGDKLDQLQQGETGLPPNRQRLARLGILGMHADEVVRVHDRVDKAIQQDGEVNVSVVIDVDIEPVKEKDGPVMVDMQEGQLPPLFTQDDKDSVPEIPNLGDVKEPEEIRHGRVVGIVGSARQGGAVVTIGQQKGFDRHVGT